MRAIILAAGLSSRLYPLTLKKPKCLLELVPGKTIIEHQIKVLKKCGIKDVIVVTGYGNDKIKDLLKNSVRYRNFINFSKYNNLHTLYSIKDELNDDILCLMSDVIFGESLLRKCLDDKEDFCLLVHNKSILKDTMRVKIVNGGIVDIGNHISRKNADGNFIGIAKFSKNGARLLVKEMKKLIKDSKHDNDYYTISLVGVAKKNKIGYKFVGDEPWIEVDFLKDYVKAKNKIYPLVKL